MTVRALSIYARAMGVNILASMLRDLVELTAKLDLDFIGIHISEGLLKVGSFFLLHKAKQKTHAAACKYAVAYRPFGEIYYWFRKRDGSRRESRALI